MTSIRVQRNVAILSVVLLLVKLWAWKITGSIALLTDALESIVNVVTGFFGLYSVMVAMRPRDADHPYGHSKVEYISASVEGTLIIVAGIIILYGSIHRLFLPKAVQRLDLGMWLTLFTGTVNLVMGLYAIRIGKKEKSLTVEAAGKHICSDAYSTYAILIGLLLLRFTNWLWIDSAVGILFAVFIMITGYKILRRSIAGIMDETDKKLLHNVISILQQNRKPQWIDFHNLRVLQFGEMLHLDAHMTLPWYYEVRQADDVVSEVEQLIMHHSQNKVEVFLHIDACMPFSCKICSMPACAVRQHLQERTIEWTSENVWYDGKHGKA